MRFGTLETHNLIKRSLCAFLRFVRLSFVRGFEEALLLRWIVRFAFRFGSHISIPFAFRGPEARASKDSHADQNTPNVAVGAIEIVGDQGAHNCKGEQSTNPQSDISQQSELPLCKWYLEAIDDLLRRKALHQIPQDEFGVVVDGAVRQVGELPLGGNNDAVRLGSVEHPFLLTRVSMRHANKMLYLLLRCPVVN